MKFSMDIADDIHTTIKVACAQSNITMRDYFLGLAAKDLNLQQANGNSRDEEFKIALNKAISENRDAIRRLADK